MKQWIFHENSYKAVIKRLIDESESPRGMVSKIADFIGCQRSYFSQVLHAKVHLNKDQAWGVCQFFTLDALATRYFDLLLDYEKAGTPAFRKHLEAQMAEVRRLTEKIAPRFTERRKFSDQEAYYYYSSWIPSAVHMLSSVPEFQNLERMAERLGLSRAVVQRALQTLEQRALVENKQNKWIYSGGASFLPKESPYISQHHQNWRTQACEDARHPATDGLHYTMVQTMTLQDFQRIKALILETIESSKKIAEPSKPEILTALNIDCFQPREET